MQFAVAQGFGHVHVHVVPRMPDLELALPGPGVFAMMPDARRPRPAPQPGRDAVSARLALHR